jgi:hypothetical protein
MCESLWGVIRGGGRLALPRILHGQCRVCRWRLRLEGQLVDPV